MGMMVDRMKHFTFALLLLALFLPSASFAQDQGDRLDKRFEAPPEPKATHQEMRIQLGETKPPEEAKAIQFTLSKIILDGNTALSDEELSSTFEEFIGKTVSLLDIYTIRDRITAMYGDAGYGLSKAVIPEQRIDESGLVVIKIIEGFIDEVVIEGQTEVQKEFFRYLADEVKKEKPLRTATLERYLLLANERFRVKASTTIMASKTTPNASTLVVNVEDADTLSGSSSIDNRGTDAVGPVQISNIVHFDGLVDRPSRLSLAYYTAAETDELKYFQAKYTEVVSNEGTSLSLTFGHSDSEPGSQLLRTLDYKSHTETYKAQVSHPFVRTRKENLSLALGYESKDSTSRMVDTLYTRDKIRSLRLSANYDYADSYQGITQLLVECSQGIAGLGATHNASSFKSREKAKFDYTKITSTLTRIQELRYFFQALNDFSLQMAVDAQFSDTALPSSEEFGVGGERFGRAYDPSTIVGDRGVAASAELRYTPPIEHEDLDLLQVYSFYDAGTTYDYHVASDLDSRTNSVSSLGAGLRASIMEHVDMSLEYAHPLERIDTNNGSYDRYFGNLTVRF